MYQENKLLFLRPDDSGRALLRPISSRATLAERIDSAHEVKNNEQLKRLFDDAGDAIIAGSVEIRAKAMEMLQNLDHQDPEILNMIANFGHKLKEAVASGDVWTEEEIAEKEALKKALLKNVFGIFTSKTLGDETEKGLVAGSFPPKIFEVFLEEAFKKFSLHKMIQAKMAGEKPDILSSVSKALQLVYSDFLKEGEDGPLYQALELGVGRALTKAELFGMAEVVQLKLREPKKDPEERLDSILQRVRDFCAKKPDFLSTDIKPFFERLGSSFERNLLLIRLYEEGVFSDDIAIRLIRTSEQSSKYFHLFADRRCFKITQVAQFLEQALSGKLPDEDFEKVINLYLKERNSVFKFFSTLEEKRKRFEEHIQLLNKMEERLRARTQEYTTGAEEKRRKDRVFSKLFAKHQH